MSHRAGVVAACTGSLVPVPDVTVHQLVERQARADDGANRVAIVHGARRLTYADLDRLAGSFAARLSGAGIGQGDLVALCLPRAPEVFAAMLAALRLGASYLPMDVADPRDRLLGIIEQARAKAVVTDGTRTLPAPVPELVVNETWHTGPARPYTSVAVPPDAPAYVIFTSGSTGEPKGVAMTHRSLVNMLSWHDRTRPGSCRSRTAQVCALSFDFAFHEIFSTLCFGGTLVLADEPVRRNAFALGDFLAEEAIERLFVPVTSLVQLAEAAPSPPALREVITTGERLPITPAMVELFSRTGAVLHNHYGATEFQDATTYTLSGDPAGWPDTAPIGRAIDNVRLYLLDDTLAPVADGERGELCIAGAGVARGYLNNPELTARRFLADPEDLAATLYRTGDLARRGPDGVLEHLGRIDDQIKIRGIRVEPGEIEARLREHPGVAEAAVVAHDVDGQQRLVAHVVLRDDGDHTADRQTLHTHLAARLPRALLPEAYAVLDAMPLTASGKTDRRKLAAPEVFDRLAGGEIERPASATEELLSQVWRAVLRISEIGVTDRFFDVGATSLHLVRVQRELAERLGASLPIVDLFRFPTIQALAAHLDSEPPDRPVIKRRESMDCDIAIIGMACRFPGAPDVDTFWRNLCDGVESVTVLPGEAEDHPDYVRAGATLPGIELFDAEFFDMGARDAATTDPQQRLFLECAWEAVEDAGYGGGSDNLGDPGAVGVFAGSSISTYLVNNVNPHFGYPARGPLIEADLRQFQLKLGNDRNYLPTRVSYKLGLSGPSVAVQTACSTSLVAVHLACQSLRAGESTMALAGGVSVTVPQGGGYLYEDGMIRSRDGHCRAFDADADGTLFGDGCGVVLLKRLEDARADGDHVLAVLKGSAVNNDGSDKVGFTAPNPHSQVEVIGTALAAAGVDAATVGYVEAHGTGTAIGDPIEIAALTAAFRAGGEADLPAGSCAIGSVKTNIGHLDEAAGIAGLIKAVLAVHHGTVPPTLHYRRANPNIDFGPFYVNTEPAPWPKDGPRRAGVSSFGMGGTNCHIVLEQAPEPVTPAQADTPHLLAVSARDANSLRELLARYEQSLRGWRLADVCFTAATGRRVHDHRFAAVGTTREELLAAIRDAEPASAAAGRLAFVFSGQGSQYAGMGRELYETQPVFRAALDECAEHLDLLPAQPALFAVEYALARLWESAGVTPAVVGGHSLGEYVAACVAGVFSLADALELVTARGRLMAELTEPGRMVAAMATEELAAELIAQHVGEMSIAAVNGPESVVVSGSAAAVGAVCAAFTARGIRHRDLAVSRAFHSPLMRPMLDEFARVAEKLSYSPPRIPLVSNVTGTIAGDEIATPEYWVEHVQAPVRFADGVAAMEAGVFVEVGPRPTLLQLIGEQVDEAVLVPSMREGRETEQLLRGAATLFSAGVPLTPAAFYAGGGHRVPLPHTPWLRRRHWIDAPARTTPAQDGPSPLLGPRVELAGSDSVRFHGTVGPDSLPWLGDHRVFSSIVMPGVAYLEAALAAGQEVVAGDSLELRDILIQQAMPFPDERARRHVQVVLDPAGTGEHEFAVHSRLDRVDAGRDWTRHVSGRVARATAEAAPTGGALAQLRFTREIAPEQIYQGEREREIDLGPLFWATKRIWRDGARCLSEVALPEALRDEASAYRIHPVLLEACLLALTVTYPERYGRRSYIPMGVERLRFHGCPDTTLWCHARLRPSAEEDPDTLRGDVDLFDATGNVVLTMTGILLKRAHSRTMLGREPWRDWLYELTWEPQPVPAAATPGRWLVVGNGEQARALAERAGADFVVPEDAVADGYDLVVAAWPLDEVPGDLTRHTTRLLALVQAMADQDGGRLCLLTSGAQRNPAQAALWGMGRVIMLEQPALGFVQIDMDRPEPELVLAELGALGEENQIGYLGRDRYVARLTRTTLPDAEPVVRDDATYLVTGGLGGLGLLAARVLADRGARHLVLTGRGAPGPAAEQELTELRAAGVQVVTIAADVSDETQVAGILSRIGAGLPPLRGVLHLAGVLDDGVLAHQSPARFERVLAAKARGAWHLHRLTADLDFFVLFSSVSAALGAPGQANYAAANAFLDGLAGLRHAAGQPALSVQWGSWAEVGMSARLGLDDKLHHLGEGVIPVDAGTAVLGELLGANGVVAVLPIDWPRFLDHQVGAVPVLSRLRPVRRQETFRQRFDAAEPARRRALLDEQVRRQVEQALGVDASRDPDAGFFALGMDSLSAIELRNRLHTVLGCRLSQTVVFDYPTFTTLTDHLWQLLGGTEDRSDALAAKLAAKLGMSDG